MLNRIKIGYTHQGSFHADDVLASVFLTKMNPRIKIKRVHNVTDRMYSDKSIVFDIGLGRFDHHQEEKVLDRNGIPCCAFGLLWEEYGKQYLASIGFIHIDEVETLFFNRYVSKINYGDNFGYKTILHFPLQQIVKSFEPKWFEKTNDKILDAQFAKAVEVVSLMWDTWMKKLCEQVELKDIELAIWNKAVNSCEDGVMVLDKEIPWYFMQKKSPCRGLKVIITKNKRGTYSVRSIDTNQVTIKPSKYLTFVHSTGFMGVANSLNDAKRAARISCCA